ncbi:hypothetical protein SDC9_194087 [bioreactor metagenome]|uniref:Uncharacterized protein n=1 Tax=bioreactor metagenome TaxID=1076179 RepID=A0A645I5C5_9ZZZZ
MIAPVEPVEAVEHKLPKLRDVFGSGYFSFPQFVGDFKFGSGSEPAGEIVVDGVIDQTFVRYGLDFPFEIRRVGRR